MNQESRRLYSRKYGQVLLKNPRVARFEVSALGLDPGARILEIGAGPGTITSLLLESGYEVTAIEPDHRFVEDLTERFRNEIRRGVLKVIKQNFLEMEPTSYDGIIGNVPYQISSEVVFRLGKYQFSRAILMLQREFCRRMVASPGSKEYSRLSVNSQLRFDVRIIANVSRRSFSPVPEVDSSVIEMIPRHIYDEEQISNADNLFRLLFANRRKKISSVIRGIEEKIGEKRVGELSPEELMKLAVTWSGR